jgi:hypothetical protein
VHGDVGEAFPQPDDVQRSRLSPLVAARWMILER